MKNLRPIHYIVFGTILGLVGVILILPNINNQSTSNPSFVLGILSGVSSLVSIIKGIIDIFSSGGRKEETIATEPTQDMLRSPGGKQIQEDATFGSQKMVDSRGGTQKIGGSKKQKRTKKK